MPSLPSQPTEPAAPEAEPGATAARRGDGGGLDPSTEDFLADTGAPAGRRLLQRLRGKGLLLAILGLGAVLRFYDLGAQSLWLDETLTAFYVSRPLGEVIETTFHTNNPPVFYVFEWVTVTLADNSEFWLRFPSAVFSTLSVLAAYLLASTLLSRRAALLTAFFVAISPFAVNYGQDARSYSLLYLTVSLSYLFFFRYFRTGARKDLWWWAISSSALIYAHYLGPVVLLVQNVIFLTRRKTRRRWKVWLTAHALVAVAYVPLLGNLARRTVEQADRLWIPPFHNYPYLFAKTLAEVSGLLVYRRYLIELLALGLLLCLPFVRFGPGGRPRLRFTPKSLILLAMLVLPFLFLVAHNELNYPLLSPMTIRYIGFVALPLWMLVALGLDRRSQAVRIVVVAAIAVGLGANHLVPYYQEHAKLNGQDWRRLIARVCEEATPDDVVITTRLSHRPFWYYGGCFTGATSFEKLQVGDATSVFYVFGHEELLSRRPPLQIRGYRLAETVGSWNGYHRFERLDAGGT